MEFQPKIEFSLVSEKNTFKRKENSNHIMKEFIESICLGECIHESKKEKLNNLKYQLKLITLLLKYY